MSFEAVLSVLIGVHLWLIPVGRVAAGVIKNETELINSE
jgi:hypothetical protein